ncbi:MAG: phospho-N-acetylmuramoyl-pentapeptide-transferase [Clostridiaceae bacterium]|nr:phospho-N-acetylmuramoyl-pentapeptide-transferase [Clostridiaceae bacterium]
MKNILNAIPSQVVLYTVSLLISLVAGKILIPVLHKLKFGQTVREEGPQSHKVKTGTPTIGGLIFLLPVLIFGIIFGIADARILAPVLTTFGFALIGFLDDYLKIIRKHNEGLTPRQKMIGLLLVSGAFTWYAVTYVPEASTLVLPFLGLDKPVSLPLIIAIPFSIFMLIASTNAVNLTDGLDGLAGSVTTIVLLFFTIVSMFNSQWDYIRIFCAVLAGGILGFLAYNLYPAKVFMGDTGALALGGALASIAILTGTSIFLGIAGIIYVVETLSVIIQVAYFKRTARRVFLMAPLHHHFEHKGWSEIKVVTIFTLVTIAASVLALILLR